MKRSSFPGDVLLWTNLFQRDRHRSPSGGAVGISPTNHLAGSGAHPRDIQAIGRPHPGSVGSNRDGGWHPRSTRRIFSFPTSRRHPPFRDRRRVPEGRTGRTLRLRPRLVRQRESLPSPRRVDPFGEGTSLFPGADHSRCLRRTFGPSPNAQLLSVCSPRLSFPCSVSQRGFACSPAFSRAKRLPLNEHLFQSVRIG